MSQELESIHSGYAPGKAGGEPERFDRQARGFDRRAGLPADAASAVAHALLEIAAAGADDLLVELGAGTGEIGRHLIESIRYIGIDRSRAMLELSHERLAGADDARVQLVRADADQPWPVDDASARVVFASRVGHLLDAEHLSAELRRVCRLGGYFLVGRVIRDPDSLKSRLRRQRGLLLRRQGVTPRDAEEATERVLGELVSGGAVRVHARSVATWTASATARQILGAWGTVGAMGGKQLHTASGAKVLTEVQNWAARDLGGLDEVATWEERYVLQGVRMADHP